MAVPEITYPAYTLTSSQDSGSAHLTLCVGRSADLIGQDGVDRLAQQLVDTLGELTGATVYVTKTTLAEEAFTNEAG